MASVPGAIPNPNSISSADDISEIDLVSAAKAGDRAAWNTLIDRYYAAILRYLLRQMDDSPRAEELTQETFVHAFRRIDQLSRDSSFKAWLYAIAANELKIHFRRRKLVRIVSFEWLADIRGAHEESSPIHERDHVQRVLNQLSPALRQTLLLHDMDGFSSPEIATMLGVSRSAAERRLSRAKLEFQRRYLAVDQES